MKVKKIPYYLAPWFLMAGASLTIGLLSFGGILALWPVLPLALAAFVLSVAYEGEIYLQNIKGSLKKLFKSHHLERQLAKKCLLDHFPEVVDENCPQFFRDYERQLQMLHKFEGKRLNKASRDRKQHVEKTLVDMEKWFAVQLFSDKEPATAYQTELREWFDKSGLRAKFQAKSKVRQTIYQGLKVFCATAGVFMGLGTTYLLVEAFTIIPWLAALPATVVPMLIVPMAMIAGVAYGLLVYNAMTDMIATEMVTKWINKLKNDFQDPKKFGRSLVMGTGLVLMFTLTLALSICTAGTWWTVARTSAPLFRWMGKMPAFIMFVLNPLISSISTWAFNLENVSETLELFESWFKPESALYALPSVPKEESSAPEQIENRTWLEFLRSWNLPRMLIKIAFTPLRFLLFIGHLISIGVTADRLPGVSPAVSAGLGVANEAVEDYHYFDVFGKQQHAHKHDTKSLVEERLGAQAGHSHESDLPTKFLTVLFSPLYVLAAGWDMLCNNELGDVSSWEAFGKEFGKALDREMGFEAEENVDFDARSCIPPKNEKPTSNLPEEASAEAPRAKSASKPKFKGKKKMPSPPPPPVVSPQMAWQFEHAVYRIERHKEKNLHDTVTAREQREELTKLQADLGEYAVPASPLYCMASPPSIASVIKTHHTFFKQADKAGTFEFLDALPARVAQGA